MIVSRKKSQLNYNLIDHSQIVGKYGIPLIRKEDIVPDNIIPFSSVKNKPEKNTAVHFFLDDYRFERLWTHPNKYLGMLKKYNCIFTPDFSLYIDMPPAMKIWNVYRNRVLGQWLQRNGIRVVPTVSWAEPASYEYCFDGIDQGGTVAISTIGCKRNRYTAELWKLGVSAMIKAVDPSTILIYGRPIDYDFRDIRTKYYNNSIIDHLQRLNK